MTDFTPRPTTYKGIKMRSRLEAGFAQWCDGEYPPIPWEYEPACFAGDDGRQYLPDFKIRMELVGEVRSFYVEVKPSTFGPGPEAAEWMCDAAACLPGHEWLVLAVDSPGDEPGSFWLPYRDRQSGRDLLQPLVLISHTTTTALAHSAQPWGPWKGEWWKGRPG